MDLEGGQESRSLEEPLLFDAEHAGTQNLEAIEEERTSSGDSEKRDAILGVGETESKSVLLVLRYFTRVDYALLMGGIVAAAGFGSIPSLQAKVLGGIFGGTSGQDPDALQKNIDKNVPLLLLLGAAAFATGYLQQLLLSAMGERVLKRIKRDTLASLLTQEVSFFETKSTGQVSTMLSEQSQILLRGLSETLGTAFQFLSQMTIAYVIAFQTNAQVAGALMGVIPVISILVIVLISLAIKTFKQLDKVNEESGGHAEESLSSIYTVQAFTAEERTIRRYDSFLSNAEALGRKLVRVRSVGSGTMFALLYCTFGVAYWYGSGLIAESKSDFGSVLTTVFTCIIGAMSIGAAVPIFQALGQSRTAVSALFSVIDRQPEILSGSNETSLDGPIEFRDVSFSYPKRSGLILNNVSFNILPGETIGLAGPSGCGKSTVCSILERFYEPLSGLVTINGVAIHEFDLEHLRRNISMVSQEPILFSESIAENIWLGMDGELDMKRVIGAAKMANAHDFIDSFPEKYNTQVGSLGASLSGGQRQRVVIARAIIRNPSILLLDEATSALDSKSQKAVQDALDKLLKERDRTTLVIAHRLSTLKNTDRILVFGPNPDGGSYIVESGSHEDLIKVENGVYQELWKIGGLEYAPVRQQRQNSGIRYVSSAAALVSPAMDGFDGEMELEEQNFNSILRSTSILSFHSDSGILSSPSSLQRSSSWDRLGSSAASLDSPGWKKLDEIEDNHLEGVTKEIEDDEDADYPVKSSRLWKERASEMWALICGILASGLKGGINPATSLILSHALTNFVLVPHFDFESFKSCHVSTDCPQGEFCATFLNFTGCANGYLPGHGPSDVRAAGRETFFLYGAIGFFLGAAMLVREEAFGWASQKLTHRLKLRMFSSYLRMDAAFYDRPKNQAGVLVSRLATDPIFVQNVTSEYYGMVFENLFAVVVGLIIAFSASWKMTLVIMAPCMLLVFSSFLQMRQHVKKKAKTDAESSLVVNQALNGVRTVYSCSAEASIRRYYEDFLVQSEKSGIKNANMTGLQNGLAQCLFQVVYAFTFWYGARLVSQGEIDPRALSRVFFVLTLTAQGVGQSFAQANNTSKADYAISRIFKLLDDRRDIDYTNPGGRKERVSGSIQFQNVTFAYPTRPSVKVLDGFNLSIDAGETVAFCGQSGSGKSTLSKLIVRFYDPISGSLTLDDSFNLRSCNLSSWREQVSLVDQQPMLFTASVLENVSFGIPEARRRTMSRVEIEEAVVQACKLSNAHKFIMTFPERYQTQCGPKGMSMSGGQRQRIAIARALIKDPAILILDEATAALDNQSEREVQQALDEVVTQSDKHRTTIIIAHRLSTIRNADRIVVLDGGRIAQQGTHDSLIKDTNGLYFKLQSSSI